VPPTAMKRTVPYFKGICVMLDWLGEFHPWLIPDDVKDLVNWQLYGVKTEASLVFVVAGEAFSLCIGT